MEVECKVLMDTMVNTQAKKPTTQNVTSTSKCAVAQLVVILCLVAAAAAAAAAFLIFKRHTKGPGQDEGNFDLHHTLREISNVRAAIHLEGEHNPRRTTSVEWKNQVDQSHFQGGLLLDNNEIVIPQNGLYFVYSQASFRVNCSNAHDTTSKPMVHLSHTVKRWSSSYGNDDTKKSYQTILHSVRTVCQKTDSRNPDEEGNWFSAVYMGALFNLRKGDRLKTVMEEKMLSDLEDEPGKTFFGVFAL